MNAATMTMTMWIATEGGRKCPICGRYAKRDDLGDLSFGGKGLLVTVYGHKNGCGTKKKGKP